ncbi:trans-sulfuration enzyme family protein [Gracilimonas mengyeensis]|uniref:L-methionine gamma-lyase n=1 Tax=Gracilimonas mengyeensis TaxID=1302730 RepID=A0A521BDK9_9BACT|nr:PLP-dependent aspartate aminotransferase family protein [Gracilimonas mengyeensis]SMO45195.1 methionine-gamma-lyase [Gracilimonas mengyeensis]
MKTKTKPTFASAAIHGGKGKPDQYGAHTSPIYQTSTFVFKDVESGAKAFQHEEGGASHIYSRIGNPTVEELERAICALETYYVDEPEAYTGMAFGSGMAAISTGIISLAKEGHIIAQNDLYGCTSQFLKEEAPGMGMSVSFVDTSDVFLVELELKKHPETKLIYLESVANPTLKISDIRAIAQLAENHGALLMVDNTFATPYHIQPLELGAHVVVHSTTKYLGGHGSIVGGALVARKELLEEKGTFLYRKNLGGIAGPMDAWLTTNGIKTLPLRMKQHNENAMEIARWLENHPKVDHVFYPGLDSHPQHKLASSVMRNGFGGMISFELTGGYQAGVSLMNKVELCTLAVSLGSVDTLIQHPASMTHAVVDEEIKKAAGITEGLVRLSVGIEGVEDIITDLEQAL